MKLRATFFSTIALALFSLGFQSCAHSYHYRAEVEGQGAMYAQHGVVYIIPPTSTPETATFKMKLTSLGIKDQKLHVRMYFVRKSDKPSDKKTDAQFLNPTEQTLVLPDTGAEIHPSLVHASTSKKPMIGLDQKPRQAVEFLFPVGNLTDADVQHFLLKWKVHYADNKYEAQTTRFDRDDHAPQQGAEINPNDPDYPYDESPLFPPGSEWIPEGWAWW